MDCLPTARQAMPHGIVILQRDFLSNLRPLLIDRSGALRCPVRRRKTTSQEELILGPWTRLDALPNGQALPPLSDWGVVAMGTPGIDTPESLLHAVQPKDSQLVVVICINPEHLDQLPVTVFDQGRCVTPESIRFIGSGMLTLPAPSASKPSLRDSRTMGALRDAYDRTRAASVILVGAGRGGQQLASMLVAAGVRRMTLIDGDRLGPENLDAMPLAAERDTNELKVLQLAKMLRQNQPQLTVSCIPQSILDGNAIRAFRETRVDAVFSFVDSNAARLATSRLCQENETMHIDVGTHIEWSSAGERQMAADVRLFEPREGCVACCPVMEDLDDALYEVAAPKGALRRGRPVLWDQLRAGSLLHLNTMAGSLAVETWLAWLAGSLPTSYWARMRWNAGELPTFDSGSVGPTEHCPFCRGG